MRRVRSVSGEGLTFSIAEGKAQEFLEQRGFIQTSDVSSVELRVRYFTGKNSQRKVAWGYGIASGMVP
jgi:O-methyltransferase involved in polyketide biosynthesis